MDCYKRLEEQGLAEYIQIWSSDGAAQDRNRKIGRSSILMRTIVMNPVLDSEDVPEEALDYALYSQICHVRLGFAPSKEGHPEKYESMLDRYPGRMQTDTELRRFGLMI